MFFKMFTMPSKLIDHMHRCIIALLELKYIYNKNN